MAHLRSTAYDPMDGQVLRRNDPNVDFASMEAGLAKEMARLKIVDQTKRREVEKICSESEELKELQLKIKAAYLNKERAAQITEHQYRRQEDLERNAKIEIEMLRTKEVQDAMARQKQVQQNEKLL